MATDSVSNEWEENANSWIDWARTPNVDAFYWEFQHPAFTQIVPAAGRRTLEVGCGEGRVGRWLSGAGHPVAGIDFSPTLVESARAGGGYSEVVCADASSLPWSDNEFDLAIAFMVLHDMPNMSQVVREIARVLQPGSALCIAIVHPINRPQEQLEDYFHEHRISDEVEQNGVAMRFVGINRPLQAYTQALHDAGFVIEQLLEPRPHSDAIERVPRLAAAARTPFFLHLRCRLPE